jgi:tetratricopeptide (TPR) repeat protein
MASDNRLKILQQAEKLFKQGKIDTAIKEYQKIIELKPDDLEVRRIIGDLYFKLNKLPEAIRQFEWISDFYLKEGFFTKAIAMYRRITRMAPQNETISYKLADLYTKQGLIIEAKQIYL